MVPYKALCFHTLGELRRFKAMAILGTKEQVFIDELIEKICYTIERPTALRRRLAEEEASDPNLPELDGARARGLLRPHSEQLLVTSNQGETWRFGNSFDAGRHLGLAAATVRHRLSLGGGSFTVRRGDHTYHVQRGSDERF